MLYNKLRIVNSLTIDLCRTLIL